jgi:hypothetical protein
MRRFIRKTAYISLPILVVAIFMEILLRNTPNDYLFKKQYLDEHSAEIETLVLGSSHSFSGINPEFFTSKAFNASHVSQTIDYDFEIFKKYQSNFEDLKTVILPISYFTLFEQLEADDFNSRLVKNYIIYYGMNTSKSISNYTEVFSNRLNVNIERLVSIYLLGHAPITCTKLGWGTSFKSENAKNLIETGKGAALRHTKEIDSYKYQTIFRENKLILNSIIKLCKERKIKVILLTIPAFKTYRENLNVEQLNSTIEIASKIASKNDNCIYINLLSDTNFVAKDFYDADHLSEIGVKKLSTLINEKINE